ncbi:MAG: hypothetical protein ACK526_08200 [Planctomyces sp.]
MNPIAELTELVNHFPEADGEALYTAAEHVAREATPEPYHRLLVHEHHMTVTMEAYHDCSVDVEVVESRFENDLYLRKILLRNHATNDVVQFGLVRFNFDYVTAAVKAEILAEKTPLGRVLIQHNVFRHIDLGAIVRFTAAEGLCRYLPMTVGQQTYGRLATIFCNGNPAVDLLEISSPLESSG